MKNTAAICMVKNEGDIIESYIRHNSKFIDRFVIIDNGSIDGTNDILGALILEGFNIQICDESKSAYDQEYFMNKYIDSLLCNTNIEFVFPLDSDEFIETDMDKEVFLNSLPLDKFSRLKWKTYIPTPTDNLDTLFVPKRIIHSRKTHFEQHDKVVIPVKLFQTKQGRLTAGNHSISNVNKKDFLYHTNACIAHFPIRSEQQVISKTSVGYINILSSTNWSKGSGYHWETILDQIKSNKSIDLTYMAFYYALDSKLSESPDDNIEKLGFFEKSEILLQYHSLANCDPFLNLLQSSEAMAQRLAVALRELDYYKMNTLHRTMKWCQFLSRLFKH